VGWTLGFGTEFDLGKNWSAKSEYDFLSFGRHTALASDGTTYLTDKSYVSQVKVGVNYKFTPGAVVAKY
jgi:opacity protein-like surface antigen